MEICSYIMVRPCIYYVKYPKNIDHLIFILMVDCNLFRLRWPFCRGSYVIVMWPILYEFYQLKLVFSDFVLMNIFHYEYDF